MNRSGDNSPEGLAPQRRQILDGLARVNASERLLTGAFVRRQLRLDPSVDAYISRLGPDGTLMFFRARATAVWLLFLVIPEFALAALGLGAVAAVFVGLSVFVLIVALAHHSSARKLGRQWVGSATEK